MVNQSLPIARFGFEIPTFSKTPSRLSAGNKAHSGLPLTVLAGKVKETGGGEGNGAEGD